MKISDFILTEPVKVPERPAKNTFVSFTPEWYKVEKEHKDWADKYDKEGYLMVFRNRLSLSASVIGFDAINADSSVFVKTLNEVSLMFQRYESLNLKVDFVYLKLTDLDKILFGDNSLESNDNQYNEKIKETVAKLKIFKDTVLEYTGNQFDKLIISLKNE